MNRKIAWILVFSLSLAAFAHGQTANNAAPVVMGNGTPNYLPLWTSHNTIGNSVVFQSRQRHRRGYYESASNVGCCQRKTIWDSRSDYK